MRRITARGYYALIAERDELAEALRRMLAVYEALMPGVRYIAVKNYAELNDAPLAARAALAKVTP